MFELKTLSVEALPAALERAERYRLLNEPELAESICLDVLEVQPENQGALVLLLLARTDQFGQGNPADLERAREVVPRLADEYGRAYYGGLICERQAKALLQRRGRRTGTVAYEWFRFAMEQYEAASELRPPGNDEALLRWNTCTRMIRRYRLRAPDPEERGDFGIE